MDNITILFSPEQIEKKTKEIADQINSDFKYSRRIVVLGVLKGSFIFCADLVRKLILDMDLEFIEVSSYGTGTKSGEITLKKEPDYNFTGKDVILVEDIVDTGNTINYIADFLKGRGVNSINLCSIIAKKNKYHINIPFKYPGFYIDDVFVVGYGLDYAGRYRGLPYIGKLDKFQKDNI